MPFFALFHAAKIIKKKETTVFWTKKTGKHKKRIKDKRIIINKPEIYTETQRWGLC